MRFFLTSNSGYHVVSAVGSKAVISVKRGSQRVIQGNTIDIHGPCRMFYSPEARADKGGARVWLETYFDVDVFIDQDWQPPVESGSILKVQLKENIS